nr:hypothetical protein [Tanacetum cinerariifolium]
REALARSAAYCRALEARVAELETHARRLEWQHQAVDDLAFQHIMRTQALKAGARDDALEDTVMSADFAVTYSFVHFEARSWSIPSENPYEEAAQQLFEHAPHYPEYVPRDHVPVFVLEFEHPEDLVPAEDEAPASLLPSGFLSPRIRPLSPRALEAEMNAIGSSLYRSLHPSGTPPLPLLATHRPGCEVGESSAAAAARRPGPTMAHGVDCSYVETRLRDTERRMMAALELVNLRVSCQVDVCTRESSEFCTQHHDAQKDRAAVRAEIEVLRSERLAYEQEEARVSVLETHTHRLEWQRQAADDFVVQHIMCTQTLEAGARDDTLKDTGTEGAIGLTCSIEKMESVFNISG